MCTLQCAHSMEGCNPPSPSKLPRKNTLKSSLTHRALAALQAAFILLRPVYELYPAHTWSVFQFQPWASNTASSEHFRPEVSVRFTNCALGWQHSKVLDWCVKCREANPAVTLCSSHKYHVGQGPEALHRTANQSAPSAPSRPCKYVFHLSKSVRQKWYLVLTVIFLLAKTNALLFCFYYELANYSLFFEKLPIN